MIQPIINSQSLEIYNSLKRPKIFARYYIYIYIYIYYFIFISYQFKIINRPIQKQEHRRNHLSWNLRVFNTLKTRNLNTYGARSNLPWCHLPDYQYYCDPKSELSWWSGSLVIRIYIYIYIYIFTLRKNKNGSH